MRHSVTILVLLFGVHNLAIGAEGKATQSGGAQMQKDIALLFPFFQSKEGLWGYMDASGKVRIAAKYSWADDFYEGRAAVLEGAQMGYIAIDGSWAAKLSVETTSADPFSEGRAWFVQSDGLRGVIDLNGNVVLAPKYSDSRPFSGSLAAVMTDRHLLANKGKDGESLWGFIDLAGREVLQPQYYYASQFSDGAAVVRRSKGPTYHVIDAAGITLFGLDAIVGDRRNVVGSVGSFHEGLLDIHVDGNSPAAPYACLVDIRGKVVGDRKYRGISRCSEGLVLFRQNDTIGYLDKKGDVVVTPRYVEGADCKDGMCRVRDQSGIYFIDRTGKVVCKGDINNPWNDAEDFRSGLARVHTGGTFDIHHGAGMWREGVWIYVDKKGTQVRICRYDSDGPHKRWFGRECPE